MSGSTLSSRVSETAAPAVPTHEPQVTPDPRAAGRDARGALAAHGAARAASARRAARRRPVDLRGRARADQHGPGAAALAAGIQHRVAGLDRAALRRARLAAGTGQRGRRALAHTGDDTSERVMTAVLEPREERVRATVPARRVPTPDTAPTPLFARHMLGAIEADRDRRRVFRETHVRPRRRANAMAHPADRGGDRRPRAPGQPGPRG